MNDFSKYLVGKSTEVESLLKKLFENLDEITSGNYEVEKKEKSLHITRGSAFLGVHFLKDTLRLNIVLTHAIDYKNLHKSEQVSKSRFYNEVDLKSVDDLDGVVEYIKEAYELKK